MRTLLLLAATTLVAANGGAQAPLTIDASFNIYITPQYIEQWNDVASVNFIFERDDGEILVGGANIDYPGRIPPGSSSVLINISGDFRTVQLHRCGCQWNDPVGEWTIPRQPPTTKS